MKDPQKHEGALEPPEYAAWRKFPQRDNIAPVDAFYAGWRQALADRAVVPCSGDLARLIRRVKCQVPIAYLSLDDQKALNRLAELVDCSECKAPYEISGTCELCGRTWGRILSSE